MQINISKHTKTAFLLHLGGHMPNPAQKLRFVPKMLDWTVCQLVSSYS